MDREQMLRVNEDNIAEFRGNDGRLASFGDAPILPLTTLGAKSGGPRTSPMMYLADEHDPDRLYVFASAAGADRNPAWFFNLVAHPTEVEVEIGSLKHQARAEILPEHQRALVYAVQAGRYPGFAEYQAKTTRPIPVVALTLQR